MGFIYEDEELELTYKGVAHKFRTPSVVEQKQFNKKLGKANEEDATVDVFDLYIEFFKNLGLPEEVLTKMSTKGLSGLFEYSIGLKKS